MLIAEERRRWWEDFLTGDAGLRDGSRMALQLAGSAGVRGIVRLPDSAVTKPMRVGCRVIFVSECAGRGDKTVCRFSAGDSESKVPSFELQVECDAGEWAVV